MQITNFTIARLFGAMDVSIPISDNRLVIVGVNGIGKSTIINIFYYFITRRWNKLIEYEFDNASITINSKTYTVEKNEITFFLKNRVLREFRRYLPRSELSGSDTYLEIIKRLSEANFDSTTARSIAMEMRIPLQAVHRWRELIEESQGPSLFRENENFLYVDHALREEITATVMYLPTYRRIEKDLKSIVPEIEERVRAFDERTPAKNLSVRDGSDYIDLVEFGMEDVSKLIEAFLIRLGRSSEQRLSELAGSYLGEVIRGEVDDFDPSEIVSVDEDEARQILDRAGETTLTSRDKDILVDILRKLHRESDLLTTRDRYSAHFFAKLVEAVRSLEDEEAPIRAFTDICNKRYIYGKTLNYDRRSYSMTARTLNGSSINLKDLSSGEKQIVSLFCHLYLSKNNKFIILIDEPELSLSVDWQIHFLPDIFGSNKCVFLAAVTHSPFIYENEFDSHAVDLIDYMVSSNSD